MGPYRPPPAAPRKSHHFTPLKGNISARASPARVKQQQQARRSVQPEQDLRRKVLQPNHDQSQVVSTRRAPRPPSAFRELDDELRMDDDDDVETDAGERTFFPWEDERTLVADLLHDEDEEDDSDDEKLEDLVESIQIPCSKDHRHIMGDIADTLVPTVKHVKKVHALLHDRIDREYGSGLLDFNATCVKMETLTITEYETLLTTREASKKRIAALRQELEAAYSRRDGLWTEFEERLDEILNPGLEMLKDLPARMEQSIAEIERQSKKMAKNDTGSMRLLTKLM